MYYWEGTGVAGNVSKAKVWLMKAADQEYAPAQYQLGKLYASDEDDDPDYKRALDWLTKAQTNGYEPATRAIRQVKRKLD